jgi:hypothetical protein
VSGQPDGSPRESAEQGLRHLLGQRLFTQSAERHTVNQLLLAEFDPGQAPNETDLPFSAPACT